MITIEMPWPNVALSPNSRKHWSDVSAAKKSAKALAHWLTRIECRKMRVNGKDWHGKVNVAITFHPKVQRDRDVDNHQAMTKAHLDGIAEALGINDTRFVPYTSFGGIRKPACVIFSIAPDVAEIPLVGSIS